MCDVVTLVDGNQKIHQTRLLPLFKNSTRTMSTSFSTPLKLLLNSLLCAYTTVDAFAWFPHKKKIGLPPKKYFSPRKEKQKKRVLCYTHANSPLKLIARVREAHRRVWLWHCRKGETKQKNGTFDKEMARAMGEECGPIEKYSPSPPFSCVCVDHKAKHCYTIETGSIELVQTRRGSSIVWKEKKIHISFFFCVCLDSLSSL